MVATATFASAEEVPRLTSYLRAVLSGGKVQDIGSLVVERAARLQALAQQKKERKAAPSEASTSGESFQESIIGNPAKAPREARHAFFLFVKAVAAVLGGSEVDPDEVQEALPVVWHTLVETGPPDAKHLRIFGRERGRIHAVSAHQEALSHALGFPVSDAEAVADCVDLIQKLSRWQEELCSTSHADSDASTRLDATAHAQPGIEFGADIDLLVLPAGSSASVAADFGNIDAVQTLTPGTNPRGVLEELLGIGMRSQVEGDSAASREAGTSGRGEGLGPRMGAGASDSEDEGKGVLKGGTEGATVTWLLQWVVTTAAQLGADMEALETTVCRLLLSSASPETVAGELVEMLGPEAIGSVQALVDRKTSLGERMTRLVRETREAETEAGAGDMPVYGRVVTVTSESSKAREKALRKERRKGRGAATDGDIGWLQEVGLDRLVEIEQKEIGAIKSLHGTDTLGTGEGNQILKALPAGTQRKTFKGYEEVRVPAVPKGEMKEGERLVEISELDDWAQTAFEGYKTLNRIQSCIYPRAYHSNENMLVCAPTGAGKTNIAMLSVLHEVGQNMRYGIIQKGDFKIVYVAPMKALAGEVTAAFSNRLAPLGLKVRELTGDMQLSKKELAETQMIVTTPEKWDVITRKGSDASAAALVRLLIIDEVHLLNDDRGNVIETLVARTLRQVEASQSMIRIVGLSATLPNYKDVAAFLSVNLQSGLFYFDASYRPVPLETCFVGVSEPSVLARNRLMNQICYDKVAESLKGGYQAMVFVHSRKDTGKTARALADLAAAAGETNLLMSPSLEQEQYPLFKKEVMKSRNREVQELFERGIVIHHAGMLRSDRNLVEKLFARGMVRVLCCTATLAWGVNLPAHTVIIKGTQLYDPQQGCFTEMGMLDVQQIFGRAGRPQYNIPGHGIIITTHDKLAHYLGMLTHSTPIESHFEKGLVDNLNAEIVLGTVTNVREACNWLGYTYMYSRASKNPLAYGITWEQLQSDPGLELHRRKLVTMAARELERCRMARFDERSGNLYVTELGRVASHYYVKHQTVIEFGERLRSQMSDAEILDLIAGSAEFEQMNVREDEIVELEKLARRECMVDLKHGVDSKRGKANVLLQAFVSRARIETFSLVADMNYVAQNAPRIARALLDITLKKGWPSMVDSILTLCKALEQQCWPSQHPLRQFAGSLGIMTVFKLEDHGLTMSRLADMDAGSIERLARQPRSGRAVKDAVEAFPYLTMECDMQPITRTVLRVTLRLTPEFQWRDGLLGGSTRWLIWVEDSENEHIYHSEVWNLTKKMHAEGTQNVSFTIPIFEPLPSQYYIRCVSDTLLHAESFLELRFDDLVLPDRSPPHTTLLDLDPLPRGALKNPAFEALYRFSHFNPIQTQAFHTLYHTDDSVLMGAPTGSGKTIMSELAILRLFDKHPGAKVIYIAPLKALVRERVDDWGRGMCRALGKKMVELTGDYTPDMRALLAADLIVCTPEKWDGISRNWQTRQYVRRVGLLVIDEIHLLGQDRGPILEVIVSRMRYISAQTGVGVRFVGLSTALANAEDLGAWLGVPKSGLFNFKPSVRPVPMEVHIQGYPTKQYCPRMATMNKPTYAAIQMHSPLKPVLVFVSSRRQTRLTALDLIAFAAADDNARTFVHMSDDELESALSGVRDASLRHTLQFGIGLHHAGLNDGDRKIVEGLFVENKIQVLVATATLAWGVNTPTHLVVIKGTEFYDAPSRRYVDYPITDVLQMMGRAGRPQFDKHGVAVVMVHEPKKSFYKKFLYEPFPVESSLQGALPDHLNAEVVAGTIASRQDAVDYLTWTYWFRRLLKNPTYYGLTAAEPEHVSQLLSDVVEEGLQALEDVGCVEVDEDGAVTATPAGRVASFYYLRHETMGVFADALGPDMGLVEVLETLTSVPEYDELPVRHNEDVLNAQLNDDVRFPVDPRTCDSPHAKANILLQAHFSRLPPPISDFVTDTKGVLDNSLRILQALVDVSADNGWLGTTLACMHLTQCVMQGRWLDDPSLLQLPGIDHEEAGFLASKGLVALPQLLDILLREPGRAGALLSDALPPRAAREALDVARRMPVVRMEVRPPEVPDGDGNGDVAVHVTLERLSQGTGSKVYAPLFPKAKEEGWWLLAGSTSTRELYAMRRVSFGRRVSTKLQLSGDAVLRGRGEVTVILVADSYLGLDQEVRVAAKEEVMQRVRERREAARGVDMSEAFRGQGVAKKKGWGELGDGVGGSEEGDEDLEDAEGRGGGEEWGEGDVGVEGELGEEAEEKEGFWDAEEEEEYVKEHGDGEGGDEGGEGEEEGVLEQRQRRRRGRREG